MAKTVFVFEDKPDGAGVILDVTDYDENGDEYDPPAEEYTPAQIWAQVLIQYAVDTADQRFVGATITEKE